MPKQQITTVVILLLGAFLAVLNMTLLTSALATIMTTFNVSTTTAQWLTSAYALVEALVMLLNTYLLGRFSSRKLFVGSIALFTIGSLFCALAPNFPLLLIGRILQASATGVVMPTVFTLLLLIFPREHRGSALGLAGLVIAFTTAIGPTASGALIEFIGWHALFLADACLALIIVIASALTLKSFKGFERTTLDPASLVLLAAGMICLLYGLSTFTSSDFIPVPIGLMVVGVAFLALFVRRQIKLDNPILQVSVFKHREFRTVAIIITFMEATLIGSGVIVPFYIQNTLGDSPTVSGLLMLPGAVLGAICGLLAGKMFDKFGIRRVAIPGSIILLLGAAGCALLGPDASNLSVCFTYSIIVIGLQALITPVNTWGINSLPNTQIAHGNAMVSTLEQVVP